MKRIYGFVLGMLPFLAAVSCSKGYDGVYGDIAGRVDAPDAYESAVSDGGSGSEGGGQNGNSQAGRVTAGEWNDLDNWDFWSSLMLPVSGKGQEPQQEDYSGKADYWHFYTNNRVAVKVVDSKGNPVPGAVVSLERRGAEIWSTVSDNLGRAECWAGLFQKEENPGELQLKVDGVLRSDAPKVSGWDISQGAVYNEVVLTKVPEVKRNADIAFIVDATGSMADEIDFLKDDLLDILNKTRNENVTTSFRTAALFYRDRGDEYVTRFSDFSFDFTTTTNFISQQKADGGGDYPEAVHTALEVGMQSLSWDRNARTKLAFLLLDAPAHQDQEGVIASLQKSVKLYAEKGIKIIPIAASGVDKNTEFMLRFFAVSTGGTYVFITNDSRIGNDHIAATVGEYQVELLNSLIIRLINKYTE